MSNSYFSSKGPKKPHLLRGSGGVQAEVQDLRSDVDEAFDAVEAAIGAAGALTNYQRTLHVGKHGDDANDGLTPNAAKLTIGSALTAASALTPVEDNPVVVRIVDGAKYTENVDVPAHTHLYGPLAEVAANGAAVAVSLNEGCLLNLREIEGAASQLACKRNDVAGPPAIIRLRTMRVGSGGSGFVNQETTGAAMLIDVKETFLVDGSLAFGVLASAFGHMHIKAADIYFQNDNAVGVLIGVGGTVVGNIDHIVDLGAGTNNKGFLVNAGNVDMDVQHINSDIAYEVGGGDLALKINRIQGSRVVTSGSARVVVPMYITTTAPGVNNDGVDTAAVGQAFGVGDYWLNTTATGTLYVCVSAATGAASWLQVS